MRRREFIALAGGAAVAFPLAVRAQQPARDTAMPVIGFLRSTRAEGFAHVVAAFHVGLNETGYVEGRNVAMDYRWADDQMDRLAAMASDLARRPVALIVGNSVGALAAKAATATVPIVFATGSDPVRDGLVNSLNRPNGNVTGVVFFSGTLGAKRLELLHELAPKAHTIALLTTLSTNEAAAERIDLQAAAKTIGTRLIVVDARSVGDIDAAFATFVEGGAGALIVGSGAFLNSHRDRVVALAARHRLPDAYSTREFAAAGGLVSYATSITGAYRQAGVYAGRILKGERPGDLPVMQPTKFEFVLNLKTAKTLGLNVPLLLQASADEVIE